MRPEICWTRFHPRRKHDWIGHVLQHDCFLHDIIEGKMTGKAIRGGKRAELLHDVKDLFVDRTAWNKESRESLSWNCVGSTSGAWWNWLLLLGSVTFVMFLHCVVGIPRLVELCVDPVQRNHSDCVLLTCLVMLLSLIHIWRCRRSTLCRSRWSPYH